MKSYLSLVPISAKVRKRQNRMTILCIVFAVFLVTAVFSMADMAVRMETNNRLAKDGSWHLLLRDISPEDAGKIAQEKEVAAFSPYESLNAAFDEDYFLAGKQATIFGGEKDLVKMLPGFENEIYPADGEAILSANIQTSLDVAPGDAVTLTLPNGSTKELKVIGFHQDTATAAQNDAVTIFLNGKTFQEICTQSGQSTEQQYYLQFKNHTNLRKAVENLQQEYGIPDSSIKENTYRMALSFSSKNRYIIGLYLVAAVLAGMVVLAGIFMIAASLNSNVVQRTSFYGMLRCLGAGKNQVMHLVRLEALNWCKMAVPIGVSLGVMTTWALCLLLHGWVGEEFRALPLWAISPLGIVCGGVLGAATVWAASASPAKKAAKVSPMKAISGNASHSAAQSFRAGAFLRRGKVENRLGVFHALGSKKNLLLMTGSFALSIVLMLCFSVLLGWVQAVLTPLKPYTPDLSFFCEGEKDGFSRETLSDLAQNPAVKNVYGRMYRSFPAVYEGKAGNIDLISYDEIQFQWAKEDLVQGALPQQGTEEGVQVLSVFDKSNSLAAGDTITLENDELTVAGVLDSSPFESNENPTIICSEAVFEYLTQKNTYRVIDLQLARGATDADVENLHAQMNRQCSVQFWFSDRRENNQMIHSTYWAFSLFVYAFLLVIALITVMNIGNSISLSVSAHSRQYGMMRAIGMSKKQVLRMITAEAASYGAIGVAVGFLAGLPLYYWLYSRLITSYFGLACKLPWGIMAVCLTITALAVWAAVYAPAKRICAMPITEAVNEL